ncbi:hypothetical protein HMPREF9406_3509 [Clostridium sp. HGF2]|nr:hypothetical protein HMPREF9406_3509 [Clostridium sp. HGF2]
MFIKRRIQLLLMKYNRIEFSFFHYLYRGRSAGMLRLL